MVQPRTACKLRRMPQRSEQNSVYALAPSLRSWVVGQVVNLPAEARSSLRLEPLSVIGFTDERRSGHGNQDRIAVAYSAATIPSERWLLAVVCDGVGGSVHGERAASTAVASLALEVAELNASMDACRVLVEALARAHQQTASEYFSKSSTTAVTLLVTQAECAIGWVGDSRAYEISDGKADLLTADDTLAAATARANPNLSLELSEEFGERLSQAIGGSTLVTPNVIPWRPSNSSAVCLLCTDGIWKPTEDVFSAVVDACRDGPELMRRLLVMSDWLGGTDNASAVMIPSANVVRAFLDNPVNALPADCMMLCLPGYTHTLVPFRSGKSHPSAPPAAKQESSTKHSVEQVVRQSKVATKRKSSGSAKSASKKDLKKSSVQLVIAEEPLDETSTSSSGEIQGDKTPT